MTPYFTVFNAGQNRDYSAILLELYLTDESKEKSDSVSFRLSDVGGVIALPKKGEMIQVSIGQDGQAVKQGQYVVDDVDIEGPPDSITVSGSACPFQNASSWIAMQTRRTRSWDNITLGTLVQGIAAEHGLQAACDPALASIAITHLDQTRESNMNLLTRQARLYAGVFKPVNGTLAISAFGTGNTVAGAAMPVVNIARAPGMKSQCKISKKLDFDDARASYVDVANGKTTTVNAAGQTVTDASVGTTKVHHDNHTQPDAMRALSVAKSKLRSFKSGSCTLHLDLPGATWAVTAEQQVNLTGWRPEVSGLWITKRVEIRLDRQSGLRTIIECETPGDGSQEREQVISDPDESGS
jgi:phage protein D